MTDRDGIGQGHGSAGAAGGDPVDEVERDTGRERFKQTLFRVLGVQAITLLLLWILQAVYAG